MILTLVTMIGPALAYAADASTGGLGLGDALAGAGQLSTLAAQGKWTMAAALFFSMALRCSKGAPLPFLDFDRVPANWKPYVSFGVTFLGTVGMGLLGGQHISADLILSGAQAALTAIGLHNVASGSGGSHTLAAVKDAADAYDKSPTSENAAAMVNAALGRDPKNQPVATMTVTTGGPLPPVLPFPPQA